MPAYRLALALLSIGLLGCKSNDAPTLEGKKAAPVELDEPIPYDPEAVKQIDFSRIGGPAAPDPDTTPDTRRERLALAALAVDPASEGHRTITFVNNCAEPIWVAADGNSFHGGWAMKAATARLVISVPANFSGRFWPRTDCELQADGACPSNAWNGPAPVTVFEATFAADADDFYDISLIDGFNVPIAVTPTGDFAECSNDACDYWCTSPGSPESSNALASCPWTKVLDASCGGHAELRTVDATSCSSDGDCKAPSTCDLGTNTCRCTDDAGCRPGQICGIDNSRILGHSVCGELAGCTTPKAICEIAAHFEHDVVGSPADPFDCNEMHPGTVACTSNGNCPVLVGIEFADRAACSCPTGTACVPIDRGSPDGRWTCRAACWQGSCKSIACTSDSDCTTGTFLRCDTNAGSPTEGQCVSTNASLYAGTGTNGQTCYGDSGDVSDINALCDGCPTASNARNGGFWTNATASCQADNGDWQTAVLPWLTAFKQACPTAFSFPFDDPTSTFRCRTKGEVNQTGYMITFCPAGS